MKTTPEQRYRVKEKRRFRGWRDLLAAMQRRCKNSQRTLEVMKKALVELEMSGKISFVQDAIRRAN